MQIVKIYSKIMQSNAEILIISNMGSQTFETYYYLIPLQIFLTTRE